MDLICFTLGEGRVHAQKPKHMKCKFVEHLIIKPCLLFKVPNATFKNLHGTETYTLKHQTWATIYLLATFLFRLSLVGLLRIFFLKKPNQTKRKPQPYWLTETKRLCLSLLAEQVETCTFIESKDNRKSVPCCVWFCFCALINHCSIFQLKYLDHITFESYSFLVLQSFAQLCLSVSKDVQNCIGLHSYENHLGICSNFKTLIHLPH